MPRNVELTPEEWEDVKTAFDVAITSMDFSSGFLDHRQVGSLRRLAVKIGANPDRATPNTFPCSRCKHGPDRHEPDRCLSGMRIVEFRPTSPDCPCVGFVFVEEPDAS